MKEWKANEPSFIHINHCTDCFFSHCRHLFLQDIKRKRPYQKPKSFGISQRTVAAKKNESHSFDNAFVRTAAPQNTF